MFFFLKIGTAKLSYHLDWRRRLEEHLVAPMTLHVISIVPIDVSVFQRNRAFYVIGHDRTRHLFRDPWMDLHHSVDSCHYHFDTPWYSWSTVMIVLAVRSAVFIDILCVS